MKNDFMKYIFTTFVLAQSPFVLAQGYHGTLVNLNAIYDPPANIQGTICQPYMNDTNEKADTACLNGVAAARSMAEKYAQSAGKYLGCVDGFYQGVDDGYRMGSRLTPDQIRQAEREMGAVEMVSAVDRARVKAESEVVTETADQIIKRYRKVIGRVDPATGAQMLPDKSYSYPQINFSGFDSGYDYDIQRGILGNYDFTHVYGAKWVTNSSPFEDRLAANEIWTLQGEYSNSVCDNTNTIFGRKKMVQLTLWDYFRAQRQYDFEQYGWDNADWSWDFFINTERNLDHYQNYDGINNYTKKVPQTVIVTPAVTRQEQRPKKDSNGNPVLDQNGLPVMETITVEVTPAVTKTIMVDQKLSQPEISYLQSVYRKGFVESYARYYARQYASLSYNVEGQRNYTTAHMIGKLIGEKVGTHLAKRSAYDTRYKTLSKQKYTEYVYKNYEKSFDDLLDKFEKNAVVEFNALTIFGSYANDEIYKPGEGLSASIKVTNLGEKSQKIDLRLTDTNDVRSNGQIYSFYPAALKESFFESMVMGNIANGILARSQADVGFYLQSPLSFADISKVLTTSKRQTITINEEAEINRINTNLNMLTGDLSLDIEVVNPSAEQTTALPKVIVKVDNYNQTVDKEMMHIPGKSSRHVIVSLSNLDPMEMIANGKGISGTVYTEMNGRLLHKSNFRASIGGSQIGNYIAYFHALASGQTNNTGSDTLEERIGKLMNLMEAEVTIALANRTNWKKQSQVEATVIGEIQKVYLRAKRDNSLTQGAQDYYDRLAKSLAKNVNNKGKGRKVKGKKQYLEALKVFSPTLSTKVKSFK